MIDTTNLLPYDDLWKEKTLKIVFSWLNSDKIYAGYVLFVFVML